MDTGFCGVRACSRGMDTVLVMLTPSFKSEAGIGFSGSGLAIFPIGAVLVDINFGGWSAGGAAGFRLIRMEGGATFFAADTSPDAELLSGAAIGE